MDTGNFSVRMVGYTSQIMRRFHFRPRSILDLCCGTGTAAILFAENGYEVVGVDASPEMLRLARKKARHKKLKIRFINQRLPKLDIEEKASENTKQFDLVVSYYDSLNYLLDKADLQKTFAGVNRHLVPGGMFIFDMNTWYALKNAWTRTYAGQNEDIAWVWKAEADNISKTATLCTVFLIRRGKIWRRYDEEHTEKAYANDVIKRLLKGTGFEIAGFYRCPKFIKPDRKTGRIAVAARKIREI
jgi:SAM-dependent methyltransferase